MDPDARNIIFTLGLMFTHDAAQASRKCDTSFLLALVPPEKFCLLFPLDLATTRTVKHRHPTVATLAALELSTSSEKSIAEKFPTANRFCGFDSHRKTAEKAPQGQKENLPKLS